MLYRPFWTDTVLKCSVNPSLCGLIFTSLSIHRLPRCDYCFSVTLWLPPVKIHTASLLHWVWEESPRMVAKLSSYELQQCLLLEQQPVIPWHFQSLPVILQGGAGLPIKTLIWQIFGRFWNCALKYLHQRFRPKMRIWPCIHTTLILIRPRWFPYIHGSHCGLIPPQKNCENISTLIQIFPWIMKMFQDL